MFKNSKNACFQKLRKCNSDIQKMALLQFQKINSRIQEINNSKFLEMLAFQKMLYWKIQKMLGFKNFKNACFQKLKKCNWYVLKKSFFL